ncbi:MAG TPA: HD domain-containing protein [Rubrobacteraceae bacterium]|nr:HD domain-containing protein [Rubrobacteraceae bacterium]
MKTMVEEIEARVSRVGTDPIWGYNHCRRVYALASELARLERLSHNPDLLYIAALLHDIGLYKAYSLRKGSDHARRSSAVAEQLLRDGNFPVRDTRIILDAIENHPPGAFTGVSVEAALLKDAVALDYLGSIGVSRVLAMVGLEDDVPDLASAVRNIRSLHRSIPGFLLLESSKSLARDRMKETERFMEDLSDATANLKVL